MKTPKYKNINLPFEKLEELSSIDYRHFVEMLTKIYPNYSDVSGWSSDYNYEYYTEYKKSGKYGFGNRYTNEVIDMFVQLKWETGGVSGGSCWDTSDPQDYDTSIDSPPYSLLPSILCSVLAKMDILIVSDSDWKDMVKDLQDFIKEDYYSENEYYGNCTNYSLYKISMKDLYMYLVKSNLL